MESEGGVGPHVLVVSFPAQGHINPALRLAKRVASKGFLVTFSSTQFIGQMMQNTANNTISTTTPIGDGHLRFEFFFGDCDKLSPMMMAQLETEGRNSLILLIKKQEEAGRPVSFIVNNPFVPWVSEVAIDLDIPFAVVWIQSCAAYSINYHYFQHLASFPTVDQPDLSISPLGLPILKSDEIPTYLHPSSPVAVIRDFIMKQMETLSKSLCVLFDSFEELELEVIEQMSRISPIRLRPVGPLFKKSDTSVRGDLWSSAEECLAWLDSQRVGSVVYVSFGSVVALEKEMIEEIAWGLLNSGSPFLWAIKPSSKEPLKELLPEEFLKEADEGKGMVVPWCPQEQVLEHPSLACIVTHCGWNSVVECLTCGVPVVAYPQFSDHGTNAKFLVDVYDVGVRMGRGQKDGELLTREVVERCVVEATRGTKAEEMKRNALKWKKAAEEAVADGGSSDRNFQEFVDDIGRITFNK